MPAGPRTLLEGACYHIIARGNQKQQIFRDQQDFEIYLLRLRKYKRRYDFKLYSYCLMPNHVHLLGEIFRPKDLAKFMHCLTRSYTAHFNKKYEKVGHLWQGRFISKIVTKDRYLLDCINYIELNPIRANIAKSPAEYVWSSYKERALEERKEIIDDLSIY